MPVRSLPVEQRVDSILQTLASVLQDRLYFRSYFEFSDSAERTTWFSDQAESTDTASIWRIAAPFIDFARDHTGEAPALAGPGYFASSRETAHGAPQRLRE